MGRWIIALFITEGDIMPQPKVAAAVPASMIHQHMGRTFLRRARMPNHMAIKNGRPNQWAMVMAGLTELSSNSGMIIC